MKDRTICVFSISSSSFAFFLHLLFSYYEREFVIITLRLSHRTLGCALLRGCCLLFIIKSDFWKSKPAFRDRDVHLLSSIFFRTL